MSKRDLYNSYVKVCEKKNLHYEDYEDWVGKYYPPSRPDVNFKTEIALRQQVKLGEELHKSYR